MFDPTAVKSPADLPKDLPLVVETATNLNLGTRRPFSFSYTWLREVAAGVIQGDLGLAINAAGEASVHYTLTGAYRQELSLDEQGSLHLKVFNRRTKDFGPDAHITVSAQAATPLPGKFDTLFAAILGVHDQQWLKHLNELVQSAPEALSRLLPATTPSAVKRFFDLWNGLDSTVAAKLWDAAGQPGLLRDLLGGVMAEQEMAQVLQQLKAYVVQSLPQEEVLKRLESLAGYQSLDGWVRSQLESLLGPIRTEADLARLLNSLTSVSGLRDSIYEQAAAALEKKYQVELSFSLKSAGEETALVDCSFDFNEEGLSLFCRAWNGDYSWFLTASSEHVQLHSAVFTNQLTTETRIELHLPYFDRRQWASRLEVLTRLEVTTDDDGRLLVYHVDASHRITSKNAYQSVLALAGAFSVGRVHSNSSFTLSYSDTRQIKEVQALSALKPVLKFYGFEPQEIDGLNARFSQTGGELDVSLAITIPGSLVEAWLDAPGERDSEFFPTYARISAVVQRALRTWLPYLYFSRLERYENLGAAMPLVVYQASRPYSCNPKYNFNYDVMSQTSMDTFFRVAGPGLRKELGRVQALLLAAGKKGTADFYAVHQAAEILALVRQRPRQLHSLLVADAFLIDALVNLGCHASKLRRASDNDPVVAVKELTGFAGDFVRAFHGKLRNLYGGQEFLALGSLLLVEATSALNGYGAEPGAIQASLRVSQGEKGQPGAIEQTLVNSAWRPSA